MTTRRIAVIGLGQRIAHVLAAMQEMGWDLRLDGQVDPAPVGAPILAADGILPGRSFPNPEALLAARQAGASVEELSDRAWALKTELPNPLDVLMGG